MQNYDLIIIGGGSAGMSAGEFASLFPKRVAIVSENIGGECLYTGCVPSKALISAAKKGLAFKEAMEQIKSSISTIEQGHDNAEFFRKRGIEVFLGKAEFLDKHILRVGTQTLKSKYFLISTGSKPLKIPIEGLNQIDFLTNENVFELKVLPKTITIVGGGPIGCELAQAFSNLGSKVTLIQRGDRLLPKDEPDASDLILKIFKDKGITVLLNTETKKVKKIEDQVELTVSVKSQTKRIVSEKLLLAVGRSPNLEGLGLDKIGLALSRQGIEHSANLQTNLPHIFVAGDIAGDYQFTHFAGVQATAAVRNIFIPIQSSFSPKVVPWCTFTDPEIAHAGLLEQEAKDKKLDFRVINFPIEKADRAVTEKSTDGFIKLLIGKDNKILGATIASERAGEMIHEIILAMENNIPISKILSMIHIYPTFSSGIQQALFEDFQKSGSPQLYLGKFLSKFK